MQSDAPARRGPGAFHQRYQGDALVLDKWFQLQAGAWRWSDAAPDTLDEVRALMANPAFSLPTPTRCMRCWGYFKANPAEFHRADGAGYAFWAEQVVALDRNNPRWRRGWPRWRAGASSPEIQARIRPALERWLPPRASRPTWPRSSARRWAESAGPVRSRAATTCG